MVESSILGYSRHVKPLAHYRKLDLDDLLLITLAYDGLKSVDIARVMCISQPAITQRSLKINSAFNFAVFGDNKRVSMFTEEGLVLAKHISESIKSLYGNELEFVDIPSFKIAKSNTSKKSKKNNFDDDEEYGEATECGFLGPGV